MQYNLLVQLILFFTTSAFSHTVKDFARAPETHHVRSKRQTFTPSSTYTFFPTACTAGSNVGQVTATGTGTITYLITSQPLAGQFIINPTTGFMTFGTTPTTSVATVSGIQVTATSSATPATPVTATVTVTPTACTFAGAPVFTQTQYTFPATACAAGSPINSVAATTSTGTVTYVIQSQPNAGQIVLNSATGALSFGTTAVSSTPITPVIITAQSSTPGTAFATATVTINPSCSAPVFTQTTYIFAPSVCTVGSLVGTVTATSPAGTNVYAILSQPNTGQFAINPTTGLITFAVAPVATLPISPVIVTATNALTAASVATATVTVNPASCSVTTTGAFSQTSYTFTLTNCAAGATVGTVTATFSSGTPTYFMSGGSGLFTINQATGVITTAVAIPVGTTSFNVAAVGTNGQSAQAPVSISATCTGTAGVTTTTSATFSGNPVFSASSYSFTIPCAAFGWQSVGFLRASNTDRDPLNYSLQQDTIGRFFVDPSSGEIKTMGPITVGGQTYNLIGRASDPWGFMTTVPVTVTTSLGSGCT